MSRVSITRRRRASISIARRAPKGMQEVPTFSSLAPGKWFNSVSQEEYRKLYYAEILSQLDPNQTMLDLLTIAYPHDPVLLCWEKLTTPGDWCHRQIVQEWFQETIGLVIPELHKGEMPAQLALQQQYIPVQLSLFE